MLVAYHGGGRWRWRWASSATALRWLVGGAARQGGRSGADGARGQWMAAGQSGGASGGRGTPVRARELGDVVPEEEKGQDPVKHVRRRQESMINEGRGLEGSYRR